MHHGLHVVMVAQALVAGEAGGDALVAAVHGDQVDVHINDQVALRRPTGDLHVLAVRGLSQVGEAVRILCIMLE